ncbi:MULTISPECIES: DUF5134 domain-containing protein [Streptomyces]|uniref:DUF5134 domain-containing protein n=2 Tax=Streptomyces griseoaurantiacus TaxID=68213 RepID=A0ABZ1V9Q9_9ACTN|nr:MULTISPECIES: DUF5134 domain-containing protein [Streptomyces]MBA5224645.1 DUF5134 domain-containing protein [Streptomyces griseoaurantiacus]
MVAASGLRWVLSLLFAVPVAYGVWRLVLPGTSAGERVDHALHAAMGVLMIAMAWPWGTDLPVVPQVVLFSVGALWFVAAAPFRARVGSRGRVVVAALPHVVMMGAMAWMVSAMSSSGTASDGGGSAGMHDMAGMDMSGGSGLASMSLTGAGSVATAVVLAIVLAVLGLVWLTRALDRARGRSQDGSGPEGEGAGAGATDVVSVLAPACHAAMALGMAVMFAVLA